MSAGIFRRTGALWLAGAVAITGAPPFGLFFSEFTIMRAGLKPSFSWAVYVMAMLLIVIFVGFMNHFRTMYYDPAAGRRRGLARTGQRLVRGADVAVAGAASGARTVVAAGHLELPDLDRRARCRRGRRERRRRRWRGGPRHSRGDRARRLAGRGRRI